MKRIAAVWPIVLISACHTGPSLTQPTSARAASPAPSSKPLLLPPGRYWLQIYGFALSDDPTAPLCTPAGVPAQGTFVVCEADLRWNGSEWVVSSSRGQETLELRFSQTGKASARGEAIEGSIGGVGRDTAVPPQHVASNLTVTVSGLPDGTATLRGIASPAAPFLSGEINGRIAFSNPSGDSSSCRVVYFTLQPKTERAPEVRLVD